MCRRTSLRREFADSDRRRDCGRSDRARAEISGNPVSIRDLVPDSLRPAARRAALAAGAVTRRWRMDPDFIVIGGQRCGTTTQFKTLADHPHVRRPTAVKGTDYYTLHYARGLDWYRSRMPLS